MAFDIESIYQNLLGRPSDQGGAAYWTNQYNTATTGPNAITSQQAIDNIKRDIGLSNEYTVNEILKKDPGVVQTIDDYDLHGLSNDSYVDQAKWDTMMGNFGTLQNSFTTLQETLAQNQKDMVDMYGSGPWGGGGYGQTVGGVKTGNELPGWQPKTGGSSGFFGRGGNRFGLTTGSLNL
tara:strand:+ start:48 stop:584 length:537 start_codon:yes stop_codon:yes gene_type:complete